MRFGLRVGAARRVQGVGPRVESGLVYHHRWLDDDAAPAPHAQSGCCVPRSHVTVGRGAGGGVEVQGPMRVGVYVGACEMGPRS